MVDRRRLLRAGDFFPDMAGRDPQGAPWHSAELCGRIVALWLCADGATHGRLASAIEYFNATSLAGIATEVLTFSGSVAEHPRAIALIGAEGASALFFADASTDPLLCLLRPDGKIGWMGTLSAIHGDEHAAQALHQVAQALGSMEDTAAMPPVLVVGRALPASLCAGLIQHFRDSTHKVQGRVGLSAPRLDPSRKRVSHVNLDRDTCRAVDDALVYSMLPMIERCLNFRATRRVAYRVALYDSADAGFFHAHRDNSDSGTRYRRYALSLALNDDWQGGGLSFPEFGPQRHRIGAGNALVFPVSLMHQVLPVERGQRFMLLSFLYDEAGARERRAEMAEPALLDGVYEDRIDPALIADYERHYAPDSRFAPQYGGPSEAVANPAVGGAWLATNTP